MLTISMSGAVGLLGDCVGLFFGSLLVWKLLKGKLRRFSKRLSKIRPMSNGGFLIGWPAALIFVAIVSGCFIFLLMNLPGPTIYSWPTHYFGVVKAQGNNGYLMYDIANAKYRMMVFCHDYKPKFYPGNVIGELIVVEVTGCQSLNGSELHFRLVRDNKHDPMNDYWSKHYGYLTHLDSDGQVQAKNCHDNADDTDVICEGGAANFTQEKADATRAR